MRCCAVVLLSEMSNSSSPNTPTRTPERWEQDVNTVAAYVAARLVQAQQQGQPVHQQVQTPVHQYAHYGPAYAQPAPTQQQFGAQAYGLAHQVIPAPTASVRSQVINSVGQRAIQISQPAPIDLDLDYEDSHPRGREIGRAHV